MREARSKPLLVDRERELADLRELGSSGQKQLAILYGRRQVGKTHLLSHAWADTRVFYFLCAALTPALNRQDLVRELAGWTGQEFELADFPTWRTIFRALARLAETGPLVVVLDEFQYLLGDEGEHVTSQLVAVWDRLPRTTPLLLVLSGSEVSVMAHLHAGGEPLYGRVTWAGQLQPFDYFDAARMLPGATPREAAYAYGILGGTPRYLAALRPAEPLADAIARTFLSPRGEIHLQLLSLLEQEKGIRAPGEYRAILTAIATGEHTLPRIAARTALEPHAVRRALGVLQGLGLVRAERNFGASPKAAYRYQIADNALAFWHHYLVPHRGLLATEDPRHLWDLIVAPSLDTRMGQVFEQIVAQAYARFDGAWGLPAAREWARWEGADRQRESVEIDVVARLGDRRLLAGEIKWSSSPRGPGLHADLLARLSRLAVSGQGWAKDTGNAVFLYASAAGFTPEMRGLAASDPRIVLRTLEDLYTP